MDMTRLKREWLAGVLVIVCIVGIATLDRAVAAEPDGSATTLDTLYRPQQYRTLRDSSSADDLNSNADARSIEPGGTLVVAELEGPGIITHMWFTVASFDPFYGRSLLLRIYWDGAEKPSVETPLHDFFGLGHGAKVSYRSIPVSVESWGRSLNCFWRMPFRKSAKITVTNESEEYETDSFYYHINWQKREKLPEDILYFHARYRQAMPAQPGDYVILETTGKGNYVGTVYSAQMVELGWFGEGDDRFYVDGEERPSIKGTGSEEYFGDAWGFRQFYAPFFGVPLWEGYFPGDRGSAYRWHLMNPVAFKKSLKVSIEHRGSVFTDEGQHLGQFFERPDWLSSVAFWYQSPIVTFADPIPPAAERIAPYTVLSSADLEVRAMPAAGLEKTPAELTYLPQQPDARIEIDFEVPKEGRYQVSAFITHSVFGSRYQPFLDDKPVGEELDLCVSGADPFWVNFDLHDLSAGKHTLRFEGRGLSPKRRSMAPQGYAFGLNYLLLLRLEDMGGYHQVLKEQTGS